MYLGNLYYHIKFYLNLSMHSANKWIYASHWDTCISYGWLWRWIAESFLEIGYRNHISEDSKSSELHHCISSSKSDPLVQIQIFLEWKKLGVKMKKSIVAYKRHMTLTYIMNGHLGYVSSWDKYTYKISGWYLYNLGRYPY